MAMAREKKCYSLARRILGTNLITAEEIMAVCPYNSYRPILYTPKRIAHLEATMPPKETLEALHREGYGLMPRAPSPISSKAVARIDNKRTAWLAIKKNLVAGSTNRSWDEQSARLTEKQYMPDDGELKWFITYFNYTRNVRLFRGGCAFASNKPDPDGYNLWVGYTEEHPRGGFSGRIWSSTCDNDVGLAPAWKL